MWTDFKKKPISKSKAAVADIPYEFQNLSQVNIPETKVITKTSANKNSQKVVLKPTATFQESQEKSLSEEINIENSMDEKYMENLLQWDFEVDLITKKLQDILKSPSPITLYQKSTELKEDFANFINYIVKKIAVWFNTQNKEVLLSMYYNAKYEKVWIENLKNYIDDLKYIDVSLYFQILLILQKRQQYVAKLLIKIHKKEDREVLMKFINKYCPWLNLDDVYKKYELLWIAKLKSVIDENNIDENKANLFLYEIYCNSEQTRDLLFYLFNFSQEEVTTRFSDIYSVFSLIATNYLNELAYKDKQIILYLQYKKNESTIKSINLLLDNYLENKEDFYCQIQDILWSRNSIEKWYFHLYIKTKIINRFYKEITRLFYWDKQVCSNRSEWSNLKWNFIFSNKSQHIQEVKEIISFKKLILELNENHFSPFLKPFIYSIVSEKLSITKKELLKIRYLMTLILSENYTEYKIIYNFFEDLETFMDYNVDSTIARLSFNFKKAKIFAADFMVGFFWLLWLYLYAPVWVFAWSLILILSYLRQHFTNFKSWIEWNFWIRTFATIMLIISWFYWITNLDSTKLDIAKLSNQVEKIWLYRTDETIMIVNKKIDNLKIKETIADILQFNKK